MSNQLTANSSYTQAVTTIQNHLALANQPWTRTCLPCSAPKGMQILWPRPRAVQNLAKHKIFNLSKLCQFWFQIFVFEQKIMYQKKKILVTPGNFWSNQQLPSLTNNKAWASWSTQDVRKFSKPLTKPITRKVKDLKTINQNQEPYSWLVPGSCQEVLPLQEKGIKCQEYS